MGMLEAAHDYAARGWAVFPVHGINSGRCTCGRPDCSNPGTHPVHAHGFKIASTNPAQIGLWWSGDPWANIGIATGRVSGIFVVDLDVSATKDGRATLKALEDRNGSLGETLSVRTGGGGMHLYFQMPDREIPSGVGSLGPGIDIRANGGYVLAPPSNHASGNPYTWMNKHD